MKRYLVAPLLLSLGAGLLAACTDTPAPDAGATEVQTVTVTADPAEKDEPPETPTSTGSAAADSADFPDVLDARIVRAGERFRVIVTMSSPHDNAEHYADGWRVLTPDGEVLVEQTVHHDHRHEDPFTRSERPFVIPRDVDEVVVEGHDRMNGYGGDTVTVRVPR